MNLWNDRRLRLTITRLGLEYLAAVVLMGLFSIHTGNNLLYLVFSLMLGLFVVSGWISRKAIHGLDLQDITEGSLFARVKGGLRLKFREAHPGRIRGLEIHLALLKGRVEPGFLAGGTSRDSEALVVLPAVPEVRGWCRIQTLEIRTRFPFGFLEKAWRFPLEKEILVFPHPRPSALSPGDLGESDHVLPVPGLSSPESARPFRIGDPLSHVHWKRTAQHGTPWIRTFEGEHPVGLRLRLDARTWVPGEAFEKELERLSGAILQARLQKQEVFLSLRALEGLREYAGHTACWRALALVQAEGSLPGNDSAAFPQHGSAIL